MEKLLIKSKIVSDDLASFQWNLELDTDNHKFNSVEEASDFPLAKEMFYLPFIKSVSISKNEMVEFCTSKLAKFKIPKYYVFTEIEKTPTGKIQKHLLRQKADEIE